MTILSRSEAKPDKSLAILEEAHKIIEGETKASIPEVPTDFKEEQTMKGEAFI